MSNSPDEAAAHLLGGLDLPPDKKFYFNGFTVATSPMDCTIILMHNNRPVALLNTSHTIAKTMAGALTGVIKGFEEKIGQQILTLDEVTAKLKHDES